MPKSTPRYTDAYTLAIEPERKERLQMLASARGVPLADAFREGAEMYLESLGQEATAGAQSELSNLSSELRSLASRVDRNIKRGGRNG